MVRGRNTNEAACSAHIYAELSVDVPAPEELGRWCAGAVIGCIQSARDLSKVNFEYSTGTDERTEFAGISNLFIERNGF